MELRRTPPQVTTIATFHIDLEDFVEGEFEVKSLFTQGGIEVASTIRTESPEPGKNKVDYTTESRILKRGIAGGGGPWE